MGLLRMHPYYISVDKIAYVHFASREVVDSSAPKDPTDTYDERRPKKTVECLEVYLVGLKDPIRFEKSEDIKALQEFLKL